MSSAIATTPLTYNGYVTQVALLAAYQVTTVNGVVQGADPNFTALIPQMLNYAELRIQRDMELLALQSSLSYTLSSQNNQLSISPNDFVTVQDILVNIGGTLTPMLPVTKEWMQNIYPSSSTQGPPQYYAMLGGDQATAGQTSSLIQLGPPPDQAYPVVVFGTIRMPSLALNATQSLAGSALTWVSTWLPDMLLIASMIYVSGYQRNFGRANDDPQMAITYESQYQALLGAANKEEFRRRLEADAWSAMAQSTAATPGR